MKRISCLTLLWLLCAACAQAGLSLNPLISDGAVLQRNAPIRVWGQGDPGAEVQATLGESKVVSTVAPSGAWELSFPAMKAGGPYRLTVRSGESVVMASDLLVGDVWVCAGQSNMYWPLHNTEGGTEAIQAASNNDLRLFTVARAAADEPLESVQGGWLPANKYTVSNFSAVGYYFGQMVQQETGIPIGLLMSTVGGTLANNWTSQDVLEENPDSVAYFERYERLKAAYPAELAAYKKALKSNPQAERPREPEKRQPGGYYNGMIAPLFSFPVAGVIWYQGESDSWKHEHYDRFLRDMIQNWRDGWQQPALPFLIVQLAGFEGKQGVDDNYPHIRETQRRVAQEPNNGLAVAVDVGDATDIHPRNKAPVGQRLALTALATVYGQDVAYHGPEVSAVVKSGDRLIVTFDSGAKQVMDKNGGSLTGFEVAGPNGIFYAATATLEGERVIVSSTEVKEPVTVRYGWAGFPAMDLVNDADLPAPPFIENANVTSSSL